MDVPSNVPDTINGPAVGVPTRTVPLLWSLERDVKDNLHQVEHWMDRFMPFLPDNCKFDEAAILVPSNYHMFKMMKSLEQAGWHQFNEARDLVFTNPFGTRYFVHYVFFQSESSDYRLELMRLDSGTKDDRPGFSPLHRALWHDGEPPVSAGTNTFPIPHLSFKPYQRSLSMGLLMGNPPMKETPRRAYARTVDHLREQGFIHAQTCQSTYGHFGYYIHADSYRQVYVKPRVNTRDA